VVQDAAEVVGEIAREQIDPIRDVLRIHPYKPSANFRAFKSGDLNWLILPKTLQLAIQLFEMFKGTVCPARDSALRDVQGHGLPLALRV
jgi:hypothetical protein